MSFCRCLCQLQLSLQLQGEAGRGKVESRKVEFWVSDMTMAFAGLSNRKPGWRRAAGMRLAITGPGDKRRKRHERATREAEMPDRQGSANTQWSRLNGRWTGDKANDRAREVELGRY
jgi:hypothetical protein